MSTSPSIVEDPNIQNHGQFSNSDFHRRLDPEILLGPVIPLPKVINVKEINIITAEQDNERDISNECVENHENDTNNNSNEGHSENEHHPAESIPNDQLNHDNSIILRLGIISDIFIARFIVI